jgi:hypothetical protein
LLADKVNDWGLDGDLEADLEAAVPATEAFP